MKNIRLLGFFLMLGCLLFWHVREMDFGSIYESASKVSVVSFSFALAVMFFNVVAVAFRSWRVLTHFGCRISWDSAYRAAMNANIASLMLTPLVGQVVGRQRLLEEHGVNPGMNAGLVVYERIVVFVSSLLLAGTSVLFYFAGLLSDRQFSWLHILGLEMTILLSLFAGLKWASHRSELRQLEVFFNKKNTLRLMEIGFITLCSSLLMSFAYAALISAIAPDIPIRPARFSL